MTRRENHTRCGKQPERLFTLSHASSPDHKGPQPLVEPMTNRELDVIELLAQRYQNKEIADKLFITTGTVKGHLKNIFQKLNAGNRRDAVEKAKRLGILN